MSVNKTTTCCLYALILVFTNANNVQTNDQVSKSEVITSGKIRTHLKSDGYNNVSGINTGNVDEFHTYLSNDTVRLDNHTLKSMTGDMVMGDKDGSTSGDIKLMADDGSGLKQVDCKDNPRYSKDMQLSLVISTTARFPAIPKCCPIGEGYVGVGRVNESEGGGESERPPVGCSTTNQKFDPVLSYSCGPLTMDIRGSFKYDIKYGDPCEYSQFPLEPSTHDEDKYLIMYDGTLVLPNALKKDRLMNDEYCLETISGVPGVQDGIVAFVCFDKPQKEAKSDAKFVVYAIALMISVPFLLATLCVYILIPELRTVHGKSLCCHVTCLAVAFLTLACVQLNSGSLATSLCVTVAFLIQFSFIACFFWLNVMCIETYINVRYHITSDPPKTANRRRFLIYSIYSWGLSLLLLAISMVMDLSPLVPSSYLKPNFGHSACWFHDASFAKGSSGLTSPASALSAGVLPSDNVTKMMLIRPWYNPELWDPIQLQADSAAFPYFYMPVGVLICINIVLFVLTSRELTRTSAVRWTQIGMQPDQPLDETLNQQLEAQIKWRQFKKMFRTCVVLFLVMGINWSMEVISWAVGGTLMVWSVFDIINALQGVVIFGIFVLHSNNRNFIWRQLKLRWRHRTFCRSGNVEREMETMPKLEASQ